MVTSLDNKIATFVKWLRKNEARLREIDASDAAEEIGGALLLVDSQLGVEVEKQVKKEWEVIITSFSDENFFPVVYTIVNKLSDLAEWKFIALKPPRGFSFKITLGNEKLDASILRFSFIPGIDGGIRLLPPSNLTDALPEDDEDLEELAWLIVETGVGEECASRLNHIEFGAEFKGEPIYPIEELYDILIN